MSELTDVRAEIVKAYTRFRKSGWLLALLVARVHREKLWEGWGFQSERLWAQEDLPKIAGNLAKYRQAGEWLESLEGPDHDALMEQPIWPAIEAMPALKAAPAETLALVKSGASGAQMRQHVAKTRTDLHIEHEKRAVKLPGTEAPTATVDKPVSDQWQEVLNIARFHAAMKSPSMGLLLEWIGQVVLQDPNIVDPDMERYYGRYQVDLLEEIKAGRFCCKRCGSWDARTLSGHHVIPRSQGGHDGPVVLLCILCHDAMHVGGEWEAFAAKLGVDTRKAPIPVMVEQPEAAEGEPTG